MARATSTPVEAFAVATGIWRWERRHPEWHPGDFGAAVASYVLAVGGASLLIDPLIESEQDPVLAHLDDVLQAPVRILITIPYHTRSAEMLWRRYRDRDARIHGHALVAKRLADTTGFTAVAGGEEIDGVARFHRIGRPARSEMPIEIPALRALAFGDAVVGVCDGMRVWDEPLRNERRRLWYENRLLPTLRALVGLRPERVLVTHGVAVVADATREFEKALALPPWQRPRRA